MPTLRKNQLLNLVSQSIYESGWNVLYLRDEHPFEIRIYREDKSYTLRIYIWNLTHGGGAARPADEYRIQITGIDNVAGFQESGVAKVLILGWWTGGDVFAGFDFQKHKGTLGYSPSIQIREEALRNAALNGLATARKGNDEIAVAFRPSLFANYVETLDELHAFGESAAAQAVLDTAIESPATVNDADINKLPAARQQLIQEVSRKLRDSSFRNRVLTAYGYCCAFCGLQLKLVDAAHVVPVAELDDDSTANGVALCALNHRAYDHALITMNEQYSVVTNEKRLVELRNLHRAAGEKSFVTNLRAMIIVPPSVSDRPNIELVRKANVLRGWA